MSLARAVSSGTRLVEVAIKAGWEVTALLRDTAQLSHLNCVLLRTERWHTGQDLLSRGLLSGVDAICHLASFIPPDYGDPIHAAECFRVNALGTLELSQQALEAKVGRFVLFSSGQIYASAQAAVSEEALVYPAYRAPYYLSSKLAAQLFLQHQSNTKALSSTILRLASVYGNGMRRKGMIPEFITRISEGRDIDLLNGGRYSADFVHVDDVVGASLRVIEKQVDGLFNVGSGQSRTSLEIARILVKAMKADEKRITVHAPDNSSSTGFPALDIQKAREAFGFSPLTLEDGLLLMLSP